MKSNSILRKLLIPGLMLSVLGLVSAPALAVDFYLIAKTVDKTMPDGTIVPMWGFAMDAGGTCYNTTPASARLTSPDCLNPVATVPGPRLDLGTDENLRIFLTNMLPAGSEPVSIVIPGQEMPHSNLSGGATNFGPTWDDGSDGPRPSVSARVRSFGKEATSGAGRNVFRWNNAQNTTFQPGTYLYHSGTHPQVQVQMGLYGAVTRDSGTAEAYAGIPYDAEQDFFFSEVDPALHQAVAGGTFSGSTLDYVPKYFLLHGYDASGSPVDISVDTTTIPPVCLDGGLTEGDRILMRLYNAGLRELAPMIIGSHFDAVAEGGKAYPFARQQYQVLLMPGSTKDLLFVPARGGDFPIIERRLNLTDAAETGGGMQTCITVADAGGTNNPPTADAGGPYTGTAGIAVQLAGSASDPDGDVLTLTWNFGDGTGDQTGLGLTPTHTYAADGTYNVTLTADDGTNPPVTSPTATATVAVNVAPTADANGPYSAKTGDPIDFDGTGSSDPEGQPLTYSWDFGDTNTGSGATPSHTYAAAGTYTVTLTVNDGVSNSAPATTTATVTDNTPPVAVVSAPATSISVTVTIDGCSSSDADGDALTYNWNFGDGTSDTTVDPTCSVVHTFPTEMGDTTYTVTLTVDDGTDTSAPATTDITIFGIGGNDAPVANPDAFNPNQDGSTKIATVAAPGVLANDTDDGNIAPLTAQLVPGSAHQELRGLVLGATGGFSYNPGEKVGVFPFQYTAFDGELSSAPATVNVTREIWVDKVEYRASNNEWNIKGKSSRVGSTVTIYLGPATGGTVLTTFTVGASTKWGFKTKTLSPPGASTSISVDDTSTSGGAVVNFPITFK